MKMSKTFIQIEYFGNVWPLWHIPNLLTAASSDIFALPATQPYTHTHKAKQTQTDTHTKREREKGRSSCLFSQFTFCITLHFSLAQWIAKLLFPQFNSNKNVHKKTANSKRNKIYKWEPSHT